MYIPLPPLPPPRTEAFYKKWIKDKESHKWGFLESGIKTFEGRKCAICGMSEWNFIYFDPISCNEYIIKDIIK